MTITVYSYTFLELRLVIVWLVIFAFFTSREQFTKIKTAKKIFTHEDRMFQAGTTSNFPGILTPNRSLSVSVPLTEIAQANQEIEATATVSRGRQIAAPG